MLHEVPNLYLTDSFVYGVKCPAGKTQELYWDHPVTADGKIRNGAQKGLGVRVTDKGAKAYIHNIMFNGKRRRIVIGSPANMNVGSARLVVQQRNNSLDDGADPDEANIDYRKRHAMLISDLAEEFYDKHISRFSEEHQRDFAKLVAPSTKEAPKVSGKRGANKRKPFKSFTQIHGSRAVEKIKPTQIAAFLNGIESDFAANSAYSHLRAMFNWAIRMQIIDMRNPCDPIDKRKIIKRRRDYTQEQVTAIAHNIFRPAPYFPPAIIGEGLERREAALFVGRDTKQQKYLQELRHFMGILFLTMARPNELKHAEFEHFDLDKLVWHKHNTKGIKLSRATYEYAYRSVPIHPEVARLVQHQKDRWPDARLVFPSTTDQTQPRDNFRKALATFKALEGIPPHFQLYDLKRIAISLMLTGQGVRREDVSHYVDHKGNIETTMIYDLGFVDPMRPVADKLGELLGLPSKQHEEG